MSEYRLNVAPRFYKYQNRAIPNGLSMVEGARYLVGCGAPTPTAGILAIHDSACSLAVHLAHLVQQSGNQELMRKAEREIQKWNDECEEMFAER